MLDLCRVKEKEEEGKKEESESGWREDDKLSFFPVVAVNGIRPTPLFALV